METEKTVVQDRTPPVMDIWTQMYTTVTNWISPTTTNPPPPLPQVPQQQQVPSRDITDFHLVCRANDLENGKVKVVPLEDGAQVAVFCQEGQLYGIDNLCAHKQAELNIGDIEDLALWKGDNESTSLCIQCPRHKLKFSGGLYFNLSSGRALTKLYSPYLEPDWKLATYQVMKMDDKIFVSKRPINGVDGVQQAKKLQFWAPVTLMEIKKYSHDSFVFEFVLKADGDKKEQKAAKQIKKVFKKKKYTLWHVDLRTTTKSGDILVREYTPISTWETFNNSSHLSLLIKLYPMGEMSQELKKAEVGDIFFIGSPKKTAEIDFFDNKRNTPNGKIGFIAGGTGITPVYQLITHIVQNLRNGLPSPAITVIYSNKTASDILLLDELTIFQKEFPEHVVLFHTITRESPPENDETNKFLYGRVNLEMTKKLLPAPDHSSVFVAGPPGMWEVVLSYLLEGGHKEESCIELEA